MKKRRRTADPNDNPIRRALFAARVKRHGDLMPVQIANLQAIGELREQGRVGPDALYVLAGIASAAERLARAGIGPEVLAPARRAAAAIEAMRGHRGQATPEQVEAITDLHAWHLEQWTAAELSDLAAAYAPSCRLKV